jgi:sarcosine oxidase
LRRQHSAGEHEIDLRVVAEHRVYPRQQSLLEDGRDDGGAGGGGAQRWRASGEPVLSLVPDARPPPKDCRHMSAPVDYVGRWLPGHDPEPVGSGTCLYTMTDDDFILDRRGPVVIASPCSGHGAKFAPLLGEMITDLALGRAQAHPRFALDRDLPGPVL